MRNQDNKVDMDYKALRKRWKDSLTGAEDCELENRAVQNRLQAMDAEAYELWHSMDKSAERTCIWKGLPDPGNLYLRDKICLSTLKRVEKLALVFSAAGSTLYANEQLKEAILSALKFVYTNWYHEKLRKGGEWWHKEIGLPLSINSCVLLMYEEMDMGLRDGLLRTVESFTSDPHRMCIEDTPEVSTGANRAWKCLALAECGVLMEDEEKLRAASAEIKEIFCYTREKDGFYKDGSFVQHLKFAYTGGYGLSFLKTIVEYMDLLRDTAWKVDGEELAILQEWIKTAYVPLLYRGGLMNMSQGREIAREYSEEHKAGHRLIQILLKLTDSLPETESIALKAKIKYWIQSDTYRDFCKDIPVDLIGRFYRLLQNDAVIPCKEPACCKIYAGMDRVVHVRDGFALGISMSSERIGKYESIHDENIRGWYTSEGTVYLYNGDLAQYSEGYFPTVNACRMPGTTVDTVIRKEEGISFGQEPKLHKDWVGGCQIDDLYGAAGMDVEAFESSLQAKKSWFLFDREIVCMGAGITCSSGRKVETIVENRRMNTEPVKEDTGQNKVVLGDSDSKQMLWEKEVMCSELTQHGKIIHLKGTVEGSDIGYYFPVDCSIETMTEIRTDSWSSINKNNGANRSISNAFATIVISHGINPKEDTYQYVILPNVDRNRLRAYSNNPPAEILENSKRVQAVRQRKQGITGANFWTEEKCSIGGITCHGKASVMLREEEDKITLAVSDPTWHNEQGITIELNRPAAKVLAGHSAIQVMQMSPAIILFADTRGKQGKSMQIQLECQVK